MSVSDNSTLDVSHEHDGAGGFTYGVGDLAVSPEEKSPYAATSMVSLEVGPEALRFLVHESILSRSEVLLAKSYPMSFVKQSVALPELDQTTAHTLVHYLYTGRYQTLSVHAASDKVIPESYKQSACVYCAAVRYELPGLTELAQNKIRSFGEEVSIFDILAVARDYAFPLLPEKDVWYPAYVEDALQTAMKEDPAPFQKPDFITTIEGNSRLLQLVWKTVMGNYARSAAAAQVVKEDEVVTPTAETAVPEVSEVNREDDSALGTEAPEVLEDKAEDAGVVECVEDTTAAAEEPQDNSVKSDDIEPIPEPPATPEPFTDELDFKSSKTYQQMGQKPEQVATKDVATEEEPKITDLVRSDSVVQIEQQQQPSEMSDFKTETDDNSSMVAEVTRAPLKKKSKKESKKKSKKLGSVAASTTTAT